MERILVDTLLEVRNGLVVFFLFSRTSRIRFGQSLFRYRELSLCCVKMVNNLQRLDWVHTVTCNNSVTTSENEEIHSLELKTHKPFYRLKHKKVSRPKFTEAKFGYLKLLSLPCDNELLWFWCTTWTQLFDARNFSQTCQSRLFLRANLKKIEITGKMIFKQQPWTPVNSFLVVGC